MPGQHAWNTGSRLPVTLRRFTEDLTPDSIKISEVVMDDLKCPFCPKPVHVGRWHTHLAECEGKPDDIEYAIGCLRHALRDLLRERELQRKVQEQAKAEAREFVGTIRCLGCTERCENVQYEDGCDVVPTFFKSNITVGIWLCPHCGNNLSTAIEEFEPGKFRWRR